ncbi:hypothetical protein Ndes2526B_g06078 [Nannochloris sp. 'desiccata']
MLASKIQIFSPAKPHSLKNARPHIVSRKHFAGKVRASGSGDGGDSLDEMFKKELKKRRINTVDDIKDTPNTKTTTPPPLFQNDTTDQLERSRKLNSEGLEGLIPRASALVQLGLSFFLAFGPFIIAVILASAAIYAVFGDNFVHGGTPSSSFSPPQYDPLELLNEPTVDPMIPM